MSDRTKRGPLWRQTAVAFILLHLFFAVRTVLPELVFCHKAGGRTAIEFDTPDSRCHCDDCEHCLALRRTPRSGPAAKGPILRECHCRHEAILLEIGQSSLRLPDRPTVFDPIAAVTAHGLPASLPVFEPQLLAELTFAFLNGFSPGDHSRLRC